jgi:hypothetical protein
MTTPEPANPDEPLTTLRGAGVDVDIRQAGRVVVAACMSTLAVLAVVFLVVGIHKNAQINRLRQHGVGVVITSSRCLGLMGGSGSNAAGYSCSGSFSIGGHRYSEQIPGTTFYAPGTNIRALTVPGDPALVSPVKIVATEHASWTVFILPLALFLVLLLLVGVLLWRRQRLHRTSPEPAPGLLTPD